MAIPRKPEEPKAGAPEYMSTYGDLVTLLLCFFVLLYAMSTLDVNKFQALASYFTNTPISFNQDVGSNGINNLLGSGILQMPRTPPSDIESDSDNTQAAATAASAQQELNQMSSEFKTYFAENNLQDKISVEVQESSIKMRFADGILFDAGRASLRSEILPVLDMVAEELLKYADNDIVIEGHTDNDPINSPIYPDNWHLSSSRAIAVGNHFRQKGFDPTRIMAVGMSEYHPIAPNDTPANKAKNRRVEITIVSSYYSKNPQTTTIIE